MSENQLSTYVLAVSDRPAVRQEMLAALAMLATVQAAEVGSFNEAVSDLQISDRRRDLVMIDLEMSGSAAVTLTRKLRDPLALGARMLPVLLIGGAVGTPHYAAAYRLGIQGYLPRPFTGERLRVAIREALLARPTEAVARLAAVTARTSIAPVQPAPPEPPKIYVPEANKPFRHGLQSIVKKTQPLAVGEAFGFEATPPLAPPPRERRSVSYGAFNITGRKLSAVG